MKKIFNLLILLFGYGMSYSMNQATQTERDPWLLNDAHITKALQEKGRLAAQLNTLLKEKLQLEEAFAQLQSEHHELQNGHEKLGQSAQKDRDLLLHNLKWCAQNLEENKRGWIPAHDDIDDMKKRYKDRSLEPRAQFLEEKCTICQTSNEEKLKKSAQCLQFSCCGALICNTLELLHCVRALKKEEQDSHTVLKCLCCTQALKGAAVFNLEEQALQINEEGRAQEFVLLCMEGNNLSIPRSDPNGIFVLQHLNIPPLQ
jgi:hypothetical protein